MDNNMILLLVFVTLGILAFLYFKNTKSTEVDPEKLIADLSPEKKELFDLAMHPEKASHTFIYAITTCNHCKKTRVFLEENNVPFQMITIDSYPKNLNKQLSNKVREYNPRGSFPTILLKNGQIITGYRENSIKEALINDPTGTTTNPE